MTTAPTTSLNFPPPSFEIPSPPSGFVYPEGEEFRGVLPKRAELAALPDAVRELAALGDFATLFGKAIPKREGFVEYFECAEAWSTLRAVLREYDAYCRCREGLAWRDLRKKMPKLRGSIEAAVETDPSFAGRVAKIRAFLQAKRDISHRAIASRKANAEERAKGKEAKRGRRAQAKQRAAEKAALAALTAAAGVVDASPSPTPGESAR